MRRPPPDPGSVGLVSDPADAPAPPDGPTGPDPAPDDAAPTDPAPTDPAPTGLPHGWVRIGQRRWWSTWVGVTSFAIVFAALQGTSIFARFVDSGAPSLVSLSFGALVTAALFGLVTLIRNARYPQPWVDLDADLLRAGRRRSIPLASVDRAVLSTTIAGTGVRVLVLRVVAQEARVEFILRDRKDATLDPTSTAVLAEALRRTSIAMPTSIHDPSGRFARYNFPGHVGRDDAVALVEHPPATGEPLPAAW